MEKSTKKRTIFIVIANNMPSLLLTLFSLFAQSTNHSHYTNKKKIILQHFTTNQNLFSTNTKWKEKLLKKSNENNQGNIVTNLIDTFFHHFDGMLKWTCCRLILFFFRGAKYTNSNKLLINCCVYCACEFFFSAFILNYGGFSTKNLCNNNNAKKNKTKKDLK